MIVDQATLDRIQRLRQRTLALPVRRGRLPRKGSAKAHRTDAKGGNALRRCPMRKGGVYHLRPTLTDIPCDSCREDVEQRESTRARAALRFIDDAPRFAKRIQRKRTITITVQHVERQDEVWIVRFEKGDHADQLDRPVFLAKYGDYTMTPSKQAVRGDPELMSPFAKDLESARRRANERHVGPQRQILDRMQADADTLARSLAAMKDRQRLKRLEHIQREMSKLAAQLSVDDGGMVSTSACAESPVPLAGEGGAERPNSTEPLVSLETAA
jgi:hypothetical protein